MRWTKVVALAAVGTVAVAGCGGGSANTKSTASNSALGDTFEKVPASAGLQPDVKGPAAEVAGATKGGTLTFNVNSVPESTDPSVQYYQDTAAIMRLTNRTLTQFKMQGNKSVLVPDMATDLGSVSKDGLTWSFTLKPNLKYEDGTAIKASDIKYSVERSFAVDELPGGPTYQIDYFKGGDTYKGPWQSKGGLDSIKADDATGTISFTMRKKFASFPYFASFTMFGGIPQAKDTKTNYQLHWISSGPYKIQSYNKGTNLTLVKNTNWTPVPTRPGTSTPTRSRSTSARTSRPPRSRSWPAMAPTRRPRRMTVSTPRSCSRRWGPTRTRSRPVRRRVLPGRPWTPRRSRWRCARRLRSPTPTTSCASPVR